MRKQLCLAISLICVAGEAELVASDRQGHYQLGSAAHAAN